METTQDVFDVCQIKLSSLFFETSVEIDNVGVITEMMWNYVVDFKYNERRFEISDQVDKLPPNHLIITTKDKFLCKYNDSDGIWEDPKITQLNRFVNSLKELWPNRKPEEFHSILFKHPSDNSKRIYLYISVDSLTTMGLNASFEKIGYDFFMADFTEPLSLDKINKWSIDNRSMDNRSIDNKNQQTTKRSENSSKSFWS